MPSNVKQTLLVMPKAAGERFGDWMTMSCHQRRQAEVLAAVRELGRELKEFHVRYGNKKHADFSPSNIYYDAATKSFTFIDVGGIGTAVMNDDVSHFIQAITIMGQAGGPLAQIVHPAAQAIRAGYSQGR
jgi:Ser/Thr protein kinase RdoA (MazF antagonist)